MTPWGKCNIQAIALLFFHFIFRSLVITACFLPCSLFSCWPWLPVSYHAYPQAIGYGYCSLFCSLSYLCSYIYLSQNYKITLLIIMKDSLNNVMFLLSIPNCLPVIQTPQQKAQQAMTSYLLDCQLLKRWIITNVRKDVLKIGSLCTPSEDCQLQLPFRKQYTFSENT